MQTESKTPKTPSKTTLPPKNLRRKALATSWAAIFAAALGASAVTARADINTLPGWDGSSYINEWGVPDTATYGQTITGASGNLKSFTFELKQTSGTAPLYQAYVYAWNPTTFHITGSALYTSAATVAPSGGGFTAVTFSTGGVAISASQTYVVFLTTSSQVNPAGGLYEWGALSDDKAIPNGEFVYLNNNTNFSALSTNTWSEISQDLALTFVGINFAAGNVIQNSAPVGVPVDANFIVSGAVTTGSTTQSNTVGTLSFLPGSSLKVYNNLFVTHGPVTLVPTSTLNLINGTLWTNLLNIDPGALLEGNGGINGNVFNAGNVSPGHSPGHINVSGNYTQAQAGTLTIQIAGTGKSQFDLLSVGGKASLGGLLDVQQLNGFKMRRGDSFKFLTAANGVDGKFAGIIDDFATDTILNPEVHYHHNSVTLDVPTFESFAKEHNFTPNQLSVAQALDSIDYNHRADKLISYLDGQNVAKLPRDFDKIAPEDLTSVFTIGISLAQVQSGNIQRRTDDIRSGSNGFSAAGLAINGITPSYSGGFGIQTGVAGPNGNDGKDSKAVQNVVPTENRWGAFLSGTGEWVSVGDTNNARGYNLESGGFTLGVDYKFAPNFAVGVAAGYTGTTADLSDGGRVYVNGGKIGLYATFFQNEQVAAQAPTMSKDSSKDSKEVQPPTASVAKGLYADVAVFGGYNSYDFHRSALEGTARGDTDGGELNVLFGTGYDFKRGNLTFGPTASFNYTYLGTNAFTEHDSLAPLNVHGGNEESLRTAIGFKASYDWKVGSVLIKPEIRAAWQHEYGDTAYDLTSSFANGAGDSFTVAGPKMGRDSALLGAGFAVQFSERCGAYVYYDGELGRTNYQSTAVTGGFRLSF